MPLEKGNLQHEARLKTALLAHAVLHMRDPKKELDQPRVLLYWRTLEQYEIREIERALEILLSEMASFPKPKHIRAVIEGHRKAAKARRRGDAPTAREYLSSIHCEYCEDVGMCGYEGTADVTGERLLLSEIRARQRLGLGWIYRFGKCPCRATNPHYHGRVNDHATPPDAEGPATSGPFGDQDEARTLMQRYLPQAMQGRVPFEE